MKRVTFWQTHGGCVDVPDDKVAEFKRFLDCNDVESLPKIMETFKQTWYEAEIVEVE